MEKSKAGFENESIKVLVRVRPISDNENSENTVNELGDSVVDIQNNTTISLSNLEGKNVIHCTFDAVLGPQSAQSDVYDTVKDCTKSVMEGVNRQESMGSGSTLC